MRYLKQTTTGHIYVWTANLASRPDMEEHFPAPVAADQPENTSENSVNASADQEPADIEVAKAAFRRQVTRPRKTAARTSGAP